MEVKLMRQYTIPQIKEVLSRACFDDRANRIVLLGSYAKGQAGAKSDIDLYLDSGRRITGFDFFALKAAFEDAFHTEIDLLPDLDVISGSPVEREIREFGVTVYGN